MNSPLVLWFRSHGLYGVVLVCAAVAACYLWARARVYPLTFPLPEDRVILPTVVVLGVLAGAAISYPYLEVRNRRCVLPRALTVSAYVVLGATVVRMRPDLVGDGHYEATVVPALTVLISVGLGLAVLSFVGPVWAYVAVVARALVVMAMSRSGFPCVELLVWERNDPMLAQALAVLLVVVGVGVYAVRGPRLAVEA